MDRISPSELLAQKANLPVLDVRTPAEFEQAHIPGAVNLPLFSNAERVIIGTLYKNSGRDTAVEKGLELVGPKLATLTRKAKELAKHKELIIHCWRGGMRSGSLGWLFDTAGLKPKILTGGYKAYRNHIHQVFSERKLKLVVLGGKTGSGKTLILHALRKKGHQILDLEQLANHKGSAFGSIGEHQQPTTEFFENLLHEAILKLNPKKTIWVENESRGIGKVYIPEGFWQQMRDAPLINISIPHTDRLDILTQMYVHEKPELLKEAFERIRKKLGGLNLHKAFEALEVGDYRTAADIALFYYDKAYNYSLEKNQATDKQFVEFDSFDLNQITEKLVQHPLA